MHQTDICIGWADYVRPNFDYGDRNMLASVLFDNKWNFGEEEITGITIDSRNVKKGFVRTINTIARAKTTFCDKNINLHNYLWRFFFCFRTSKILQEKWLQSATIFLV